ncbi:MAG: metalloregulator ArsR/SmtB family transcription factor [Hyphomicrobiales bacterium]|nr:metalloregulator ArsR/SmtB family transcription factor [Hyphomicrobiales bacterium]
MMIQQTAPARDMPTLFGALADPHRLAIVETLVAEGEKTVGELVAPFKISAPAISRHLAVLESAGVIERRVDRQWRVCRIRPDALAAIEGWVEAQRRFWNASLDRLERMLAENTDNETSSQEEIKR